MINDNVLSYMHDQGMFGYCGIGNELQIHTLYLCPDIVFSVFIHSFRSDFIYSQSWHNPAIHSAFHTIYFLVLVEVFMSRYFQGTDVVKDEALLPPPKKS